MQIKDYEQRGAQQRSMYDKMFNALETNENETGKYTINLKSGAHSKKPEEQFNSTQMSFGKEIEEMHK